MTMEIYLLAQLEAHTEQHFLDDIVKLPPANMEQINPLTGNSVTLHFGRKINIDITLITDGILQLPYTKLQLDMSASYKRLGPFCWLSSDDEDPYNNPKWKAVVRYYVMAKGFDGRLFRFSGDYLAKFKAACAESANGVRTKEAAVDDPSKWGPTTAGQSQVQKVGSTSCSPP
jgi:hypothetical protein